jgi:hypothetical protein
MVQDPRAKKSPHRIVPVDVPTPVRVEAGPGGAPASVAGRPVVTIRSRWRIDDEWWRDRAISRMYYALLLEDGRVLTVFNDLLNGEWFEQRY